MFKIIKRYILTIVIILGIILFALVVKAVNDSYRINKTVSLIINEQGSCKSVTNNSATNDYFIPTKTLNEWNLFKQNKPSDVSLGSCYQCPENSQIYSDLSSCTSACTQTASCTQVGCSATFTYSSDDSWDLYCSGCSPGEFCIDGRCPGVGNPSQCLPSGCYQVGKSIFIRNCGEYDCGYYRYHYECATITPTYACPLSGGSACTGPGICTAGTACTILP